VVGCVFAVRQNERSEAAAREVRMDEDGADFSGIYMRVHDGANSAWAVIAAKDNAESPLRIYGPGSNLADHRLLEVTAGGELILAGGTGNGYRLAELMGATNPSGWSGVLKVKTPAGATAGYILLYSNP